ncbi:phage tail tape measure protein [Klebsiella pneumoniae]|uniref:phage tail tape measure protein n=1 Tax=Klebsiella pneumoniae TaxID=573 RepID=UPI00237F9B53|nr:phage tail tape measure protein [Klebsiella pneumoniae]EKT8241702.1 phage tail tape measure protein [Klebsiella oxytoca]WMW97859.1 phage tail tape measure protein [Klebsiella pneumoniae]WRO69678.1 phage tail tape measure protein [Klebsiella pneumoniae]
MRDLKLAMTLLARDQGSKALRQALTDIFRQTNANKKAEDDAARAREQSSREGIRASRTLQQEYQRAASARSTLGIRSEKDIQREIMQTQAAYNRLLRSGTMSANEQTRAFRAMTSQVSQLRTELNGAGQSMSKMERMRNWGGNATAIAGGVTAAAAVLREPVRNQMSYEQRLAMMANTAFADEGIAGRRSGMQSMDQLIRRAVSVGGGNKESAAGTLDALLASGAVDFKSAEQLLPMLQKYSTATGADPQDLAMIAIRLKQTFGVQNEDIPKALNMAIKAGQAGSFELADMAKYLPEQLANAGNAGMKGLDDFATLLGLNQAAAITAGSSSQAGNNVTQFLAKITSRDASTAAERIKYNGKGIDLPGSLVNAQGKGMNSIDAFSAIVDKIVASNPEYSKLEKRLANSTDSADQQRIMASQVKILEGSSVGQIIADQQALMALVAYRSNRKYAYGVRDSANAQRTLADGATAGDLNYELMSDTAGFKTNQLGNQSDFAQMDAIRPLSEVLGTLSKNLTDYAAEYPGLTTAVAGATTGIKALAAAAAAIAGIRFLTGGGLPGFGKKGAGGGSFNPSDLVTGGGASGAGVVPVYVTNWKDIGGDEKNGLMDALKDVPGAVGKFATYFTAAAAIKGSLDEQMDEINKESQEKGVSPGELLKQKMDAQKTPLFDWDFSSWWSSPQNVRVPESANGYPVPPFAQGPAQNLPINITTQLQVDGRVLAEVVNEANSQSATRGPQGGPH